MFGVNGFLQQPINIISSHHLYIYIVCIRINHTTIIIIIILNLIIINILSGYIHIYVRGGVGKEL